MTRKKTGQRRQRGKKQRERGDGNEQGGEEERLGPRGWPEEAATRGGDESGPNRVQRPLLLGQLPHGTKQRALWTGRTDRRTDGRVVGRTYGWTDVCTSTNGQSDGRTWRIARTESPRRVTPRTSRFRSVSARGGTASVQGAESFRVLNSLLM